MSKRTTPVAVLGGPAETSQSTTPPHSSGQRSPRDETTRRQHNPYMSPDSISPPLVASAATSPAAAYPSTHTRNVRDADAVSTSSADSAPLPQSAQPAAPTRVAPPQNTAPTPVRVTAAQLEKLLARAKEAEGAARHVDVTCPAGFSLTVYNGDISQHFSIPSEHVQVTRGSIKYVDHHARYGAQTRFRFQLCHNYLLRKCPKLSECSYIHATQLPAPTQVHLNPFAPRRLAADRHGRSDDVAPSVQDDPSVVESYETLPPGFTLTVHAPNSNHVTGAKRGPPLPQNIPSDRVIVTVGAKTALDFLRNGRRSGDGGAVGARPRHCAHFQYRRLCNLGNQCHFIHSKVPFAEAPVAQGAAPKHQSTAAAPPQHHQHQQQQQQQAQAQPTGPFPPMPQYHAAQHAGHAASPNHSGPNSGAGSTPAGSESSSNSFFAGMQFALQMLGRSAPQATPPQPSQPPTPYTALGYTFHTLAGPMNFPVQSPPTAGATPMTAGISGIGAAGAAGPLANIPAEKRQA